MSSPRPSQKPTHADTTHADNGVARSVGEPQDVRERILTTATRMFALQGYGSTSVREVVEAVGCTKPMLYYYFGSKEDLFLTAVRTEMAGFSGIIEQALEQEGSVRSRLGWFIDRFLLQVRDHPHAMRLLMTAQHPTDRGQPEIDVMPLHRHNGVRLAQLLEDGVGSGEIRADLDIRDMALAFMGMVQLRTLACMHDQETPDDVAIRVLDIFFEGVKS